jgi:hypothetical protein
MSHCVLGKGCKATSGMSPFGFCKVVRQPFGSSGSLDPHSPDNELIFGLGF